MSEQTPQSPDPPAALTWLQRTLQRFRRQRAGGDVIAADVSGSQGVAVGKNIVQIGTLAIPALPLVLLILLIAAASGLAIWRANSGPRSMPPGAFNIAIATIAETNSRGELIEAERGQIISGWIGRALERANATSPYGSANVTIWYDQLPRTQMGVRLGIVGGASPELRRLAAPALANRVNADVLIYGTIAADNRFVPEFYVKPQSRLEYDANAGSFQLGATPILADMSASDALESAVTKRANALFWLIKGLQFSSRGETDQALAVWGDATRELGNWDGREILAFLRGQAALYSAQRAQSPSLFQDDIAKATEAFSEALRLNPNYIRAYIGRGSLSKTLADRMAPADRIRSPLIPSAIRDYQHAKRLATAAGDQPRELGTASGALGSAYRLLGDTYLGLAESTRASGDTAGAAPLLGLAEQQLDTAIAELQAALDPLKRTGEPRLLGQAYLALGNAASQKAIVRGLENDPAGQRQWYAQAATIYASCIEQGAQLAAPDDILTNDIIAQRCQPQKQVAEQKAATK